MEKETEKKELQEKANELDIINNEIKNANRLRAELSEINEKLKSENVDIRYFLKHRSEMKDIIHSLALDLQKVKEDIENDTKVRDELIGKIKDLEDYIVSLKDVVLKQAQQIQKDRDGWQSEAATHDKNMFAGGNTLTSIQEEIKKVTKHLNKLKKKESEYQKVVDQIESLSEDVSSLSKIKSKLAKEVKALGDKRDDENDRAVDLKALAQELTDSIVQVHKDTQDYRNKIYFYIRRIVKYYRERGERAPLVFEEFKPNVPIRADILKRLKLIARRKELATKANV